MHTNVGARAGSTVSTVHCTVQSLYSNVHPHTAAVQTQIATLQDYLELPKCQSKILKNTALL